MKSIKENEIVTINMRIPRVVDLKQYHENPFDALGKTPPSKHITYSVNLENDLGASFSYVWAQKSLAEKVTLLKENLSCFDRMNRETIEAISFNLADTFKTYVNHIEMSAALRTSIEDLSKVLSYKAIRKSSNDALVASKLFILLFDRDQENARNTEALYESNLKSFLETAYNMLESPDIVDRVAMSIILALTCTLTILFANAALIETGLILTVLGLTFAAIYLYFEVIRFSPVFCFSLPNTTWSAYKAMNREVLTIPYNKLEEIAATPYLDVKPSTGESTFTQFLMNMKRNFAATIKTKAQMITNHQHNPPCDQLILSQSTLENVNRRYYYSSISRERHDCFRESRIIDLDTLDENPFEALLQIEPKKSITYNVIDHIDLKQSFIRIWAPISLADKVNLLTNNLHKLTNLNLESAMILNNIILESLEQYTHFFNAESTFKKTLRQFHQTITKKHYDYQADYLIITARLFVYLFDNTTSHPNIKQLKEKMNWEDLMATLIEKHHGPDYKTRKLGIAFSGLALSFMAIAYFTLSIPFYFLCTGASILLAAMGATSIISSFFTGKLFFQVNKMASSYKQEFDTMQAHQLPQSDHIPIETTKPKSNLLNFSEVTSTFDYTFFQARYLTGAHTSEQHDTTDAKYYRHSRQEDVQALAVLGQ